VAPKIRKIPADSKSSFIREAKEAAQKPVSELVNFSFKYLDETRDKFPCFIHDHDYYFEVVKRLKALCTIKAIELLTNRSSTLRAHPINWSDTTEPRFGFPGEELIIDTPYQLSLSANKHGRLHGFFIANTFYIVWFDQSHALYQ
jgi:hypothetical protein